MAHSQYSFSWDSHKSSICGGFCALQQNGEFVDMTLAADGHFVKVHQVLLALASPYLKELITSAPCPHPVIFLNNVSNTTLMLLLEYIYTGEAIVPPSSLQSFIEAAKSLQIKGLDNIRNESYGTNIEVRESPSKNLTIDSLTKALKIPPIAKTVSIKPETSSTTLNITTASNKDDGNDFSMDFDSHMADDDDDTDFPQDKPKVNKSSDVGLKSSNLQYTVSIRGSLQVILNRFMYNLQSTQSSGIKRWRCIDYRNLKCTAFLVTKDNVVLNRGNPHCHAFHDKKILQKIEKNAVFSALYELEAHQEKEKQNEQDDETENIEYITNDSTGALPDLTGNSES